MVWFDPCRNLLLNCWKIICILVDFEEVLSWCFNHVFVYNLYKGNPRQQWIVEKNIYFKCGHVPGTWNMYCRVKIWMNLTILLHVNIQVVTIWIYIILHNTHSYKQLEACHPTMTGGYEEDYEDLQTWNPRHFHLRISCTGICPNRSAVRKCKGLGAHLKKVNNKAWHLIPTTVAYTHIDGNR